MENIHKLLSGYGKKRGEKFFSCFRGRRRTPSRFVVIQHRLRTFLTELGVGELRCLRINLAYGKILLRCGLFLHCLTNGDLLSYSVEWVGSVSIMI